MNDGAVEVDGADDFAVSRSMRIFGYLCHEYPALWTRVANLETALLEDKLGDVDVEKPIYVTSLARSGTTVLLEFLASCAGVATHRYKDFPPVLTPWFWNRFLELVPQTNAVPRERPHGDGVMITPDSPEAMEEVLWMRFFPDAHNPRISNRLDRDTRNSAFAQFYLQHIKKLLFVRKGRRYLAKGNYNIARLGYLHELLPDARFIVPVRHPFTHIPSMIRQHDRFSAGQRAHPAARAHLRRVGHFEFGLDRVPINMGDTTTIEEILHRWETLDELGGWALYWSHIYGSLQGQLDADARLREAVLVVRYEDLCAHPEPELAKVFEHSGLNVDTQSMRALAGRLRRRDYYKTGMSAAERTSVLDAAASTMAIYGYSATS